MSGLQEGFVVKAVVLPAGPSYDLKPMYETWEEAYTALQQVEAQAAEDDLGNIAFGICLRVKDHG